jgi:hypothetical protein
MSFGEVGCPSLADVEHLLVKSNKWDLVSLDADSIQIQGNLRWHLCGTVSF